MKRIAFILAMLGVLILIPVATFTDEGMWMLTQLDKLPWANMQKHGLVLNRQQIYSDSSASIKDAIVLLGGGTSSFVSADGLVLTNHHVAFGAIQSVTSVQDDYLMNGFYAKTREEELSVPTYTAQIVVGIKDVSKEILSAVSDTMGAESRAKAVSAKRARSKRQPKVPRTSRMQGFRNVQRSEVHSLHRMKCFGRHTSRLPPASIGNLRRRSGQLVLAEAHGRFLVHAGVCGTRRQDGQIREAKCSAEGLSPDVRCGLQRRIVRDDHGISGQNARYRRARKCSWPTMRHSR